MLAVLTILLALLGGPTPPEGLTIDTSEFEYTPIVVLLTPEVAFTTTLQGGEPGDPGVIPLGMMGAIVANF